MPGLPKHGSLLGIAAANNSCKLSLNVSLFRVTRKLAPKNSAPLSLRKASSGMTSFAAAPLLLRTAYKAANCNLCCLSPLDL